MVVAGEGVDEISFDVCLFLRFAFQVILGDVYELQAVTSFKVMEQRVLSH